MFRRQPQVPKISVIIPVRNAADTLGECLTRIYDSGYENFEVLVLDDGGSSDGSDLIAQRYPCRLLRLETRNGPAACRNVGALQATGDILLFVDADVMIPKNFLALVAETLRDPRIHGVIGVQSQEMRFTNFLSRYKNLWMRYTYLRLCGNGVPLFYTSAAAIRKEVFLRVGGLDTRYTCPSVEDTDFGQKLLSQGFRVTVNSKLEIEHVKGYTFISLLRTDFWRSVALTRLKLRNRFARLTTNNTSVPLGYMASVPLSLLGLVSLVIFFAAESAWPVMGLGFAVIGIAGMNRGFLDFLAKSGGRAFAAKSFFTMLVEMVVAGAGVVYGLITFPLGKKY